MSSWEQLGDIILGLLKLRIFLALVGIFLILALCIGAIVVAGVTKVVSDIQAPTACNNLETNLAVTNAQVIFTATNKNDFEIEMNASVVQVDDGGQPHTRRIGKHIKQGETIEIVLTEFPSLSKSDGLLIEYLEQVQGDLIFDCNTTVPFTNELAAELESEFQRACSNVEVKGFGGYIVVTNNNTFPIAPDIHIRSADGGYDMNFKRVNAGATEEVPFFGELRGIALARIQDTRTLFDYIECNQTSNQMSEEGTYEVPPTSTPEPPPCNKATLLSEQTIQNGIEVEYVLVGSEFVKSWTVRNDGVCTWASSYSLVFISGYSFDTPPAMSISSEVKPGETLVLNLPITAPKQQGRWHGEWKLRDENLLLFKDSDPLELQLVVITLDQVP